MVRKTGNKDIVEQAAIIGAFDEVVMDDEKEGQKRADLLADPYE